MFPLLPRQCAIRIASGRRRRGCRTNESCAGMNHVREGELTDADDLVRYRKSKRSRQSHTVRGAYCASKIRMYTVVSQSQRAEKDKKERVTDRQTERQTDRESSTRHSETESQ